MESIRINATHGPAGSSELQRRNTVVSAIFYLTIVLFCIVDIVNTLQLIRGDDFTAGQIFRGGIFLLLAIINVRYIKQNSSIFLVYILLYYFIVVEVVNFMILQYPLKHMLKGVSVAARAFLPFFLYFYIMALSRKGLLSYRDIRRGFFLYVLFFSANIIMPVLAGVSQFTYGSTGFKGFYYAQNEMGAFITVAFPVLLYFYMQETKNKAGVMALLIMLIVSGVLTGTKTPIFSILLSLALVPLILSRKRILVISSMTIISLGVFFIIIVQGSALLDYLPSKIYGRLLWTISKRDSIWEILLGARLDYLDQYIENISNKNIFEILFGSGYLYSGHFLIKRTVDIYGSAEMDAVDLLARYGVLGILGVCVMLVIIVRNHYKSMIPMSNVVLFMLILLTVNAVLAGHVLFNVLHAYIVAIIFVMNKIKQDEFERLH